MVGEYWGQAGLTMKVVWLQLQFVMMSNNFTYFPSKFIVTTTLKLTNSPDKLTFNLSR